MAGRKKNAKNRANDGATIGYEAQLWQMADALRGSMDAAEYKHVVLGLIFLKFISDAFEEQHARLEAEKSKGADPEHPDAYRAHSIFWVPSEARWTNLKALERQPTIGQLVDDAMTGIEGNRGSTEYIVLRPKPQLPEEFAYYLARSDEFREFAIQSMTGSSGRQLVPAELLYHFRVVAASEPIAELFGRCVKPLFASASAAPSESCTFAALRDTLLPKLISDELRVRPAERFIARVEA